MRRTLAVAVTLIVATASGCAVLDHPHVALPAPPFPLHSTARAGDASVVCSPTTTPITIDAAAMGDPTVLSGAVGAGSLAAWSDPSLVPTITPEGELGALDPIAPGDEWFAAIARAAVAQGMVPPMWGSPDMLTAPGAAVSHDFSQYRRGDLHVRVASAPQLGAHFRFSCDGATFEGMAYSADPELSRVRVLELPCGGAPPSDDSLVQLALGFCSMLS